MLGQPGATRRLRPKIPDDHELLTQDITDLATRYGRYGYRRVTALPRDRGWQVNHKRVERIWRREGLKVPKKQPKRKTLAERWIVCQAQTGNDHHPQGANNYRQPCPDVVVENVVQIDTERSRAATVRRFSSRSCRLSLVLFPLG